jgi:hypothetical protein
MTKFLTNLYQQLSVKYLVQHKLLGTNNTNKCVSTSVHDLHNAVLFRSMGQVSDVTDVPNSGLLVQSGSNMTGTICV